MSATYRARDTLRNSSVTAQIKKPTQKGCEKARRTSLPSDCFATSRRLSTTGANCGIKLINHRLDYRTEPLSAFDYRANHAHGIVHSHRATTRSITASPATSIVSSTDHIVAWLILTIVPTFGPQRFNLIASNSLLPATFAATIATGHIAATTTTSDTSPPLLPTTPRVARPLPAMLRRHRYQ